MSAVVHECGEENDGKSQRHHNQRTGEDPIGQADCDDRRLGENRYGHECQRVERDRAPNPASPAE